MMPRHWRRERAARLRLESRPTTTNKVTRDSATLCIALTPSNFYSSSAAKGLSAGFSLLHVRRQSHARKSTRDRATKSIRERSILSRGRSIL